jgi:hypothetical protein
MYVVLLAAALAVGSGDGRYGATDSRMVEKLPPYARLRLGMSYDQMTKVFGRSPIYIVATKDGPLAFYEVGPDELGHYHQVVVITDTESVTNIKVTQLVPPVRNK